MSPRELEVLTLMCEGVTSTNDLCSQLHLAERTIKAILSDIYAKLGVTDRAGAVAAAFREGIIDPADLSRA